MDSFIVTWFETDLWIGVDKGSLNEHMKRYARECIIDLRSVLENYNRSRAGFFSSHDPLPYDKNAPLPVKKMLSASLRSGTGPMSSVAGLFAGYVGESLREKFQLNNIIIENGGDNYLSLSDIDADLPIVAPSSPLTEQLGIRIKAGETPLGICTSSGRSGHSFSYGKAHSVTVISKEITLADAFATKLCNMTKSEEHLESTLEAAMYTQGISGCVIIIDDLVGIKGDCEIIRLKNQYLSGVR